MRGNLRRVLRESSAIRIDWHLGERSFDDANRLCLLRLSRLALEDRRSRLSSTGLKLIALAEGLNRGQPATLLAVGLNLPALARLPGRSPARNALASAWAASFACH